MRLVCIFFLLVTSNFLKSQNPNIGLDKNLTENNKKKLFFKVASELRVTPIPFDLNFPKAGTIFTNVDKIHSGPAVSYGIEYFTGKNFSLSLNHSFRQERVINDLNPIESGQSASIASHTLLQGFHLSGTKYFYFKNKDFHVFLRAGFSVFNIGSDFTFKEVFDFGDNQNNVVFITEGDFQNFGYNVSIGIEYKRLSGELGVYLSNGSAYFERNFRIVTPFIKISYRLGRVW